MKKKKVRFDEVKRGECFKYYGVVYRKAANYQAGQLTGKTDSDRSFFNDDKVIPVTVTFKVKEK